MNNTPQTFRATPIPTSQPRGRKPFAKSNPQSSSSPPPIVGSTSSLKEYHKVDSDVRKDPSVEKGHRSRNMTPVVYISRWIVNLFPACEQNTCLSAAILLGSQEDPELIMMPQMKVYDRPTAYAYHHHFEGAAYDRLWTFGDGIAMQDFKVIVRTALYAGLKLPGWQIGTFNDTSRSALTVHAMVALLSKAGVRPARPDLIPPSVYDDLRLDPVNAGDFISV